MTKILYIVTQSELGGAQRYIFDLANNLPKNEYIVNVASGGNNGLFDRVQGAKIASHKLKHLTRAISPIADIKAYFELKQLISEIKPDIVHLNSSKAGFLGSLAAKKLNVPKIIYTAHGFVFNEPMNPIKRWIYKRAELSNAKRVNKIITVSEYDKQTGIKAGIPENKLICIHNGIATDIEFLTKNDARDFLISHTRTPGFQDSRIPLIGCIANFYRTKGLDVLIDAMTDIDAKLILIGEGDLRSELEAQIKKLGLENKVTLTGAITDATQYLKAFDLFALASHKEGLPYTILEAQAAQIPIVATKVGGTPEIIQDNVNGYLVEPNNADDLANKINHALANPITSQLTDDFTLNKMLKKTIKVYISQ